MHHQSADAGGEGKGEGLLIKIVLFLGIAEIWNGWGTGNQQYLGN